MLTNTLDNPAFGTRQRASHLKGGFFIGGRWWVLKVLREQRDLCTLVHCKIRKNPFMFELASLSLVTITL